MAEARDTRRVRVLIVDDQQLFTDALRALLDEDERFDVAGTAQSGREALVLARAAQVDVVLMDMSMPILDGVAATRKLLALEAPPRVIAVSGHTDSLSRAAALEAGAIAYLTKDDVYEKLGDTILEVAGR